MVFYLESRGFKKVISNSFHLANGKPRTTSSFYCFIPSLRASLDCIILIKKLAQLTESTIWIVATSENLNSGYGNQNYKWNSLFFYLDLFAPVFILKIKNRSFLSFRFKSILVEVRILIIQCIYSINYVM